MNPLRDALLWASRNPFLATSLPQREFVQRAVRRFMPGEKLSDALREARSLTAEGTGSIVTLLGENVESLQDTAAVRAEYLAAAEAAASPQLDLQISVKLTQLGLDLDQAHALELLTELSEAASATVWIDMESSDYVDRTLAIYEQLRGAGHDIGVCLQAYLRRTPEDLDRLLPLNPAIRLVKGAYAEPVRRAFPARGDVDAAYRRLASTLFDHLAHTERGFVALATHDPVLVRELRGRIVSRGLATNRYEFEMLYGIGAGLKREIREAGLPLRVLISYGSAWFPWYMRRLAERPANVLFVLRSLWR